MTTSTFSNVGGVFGLLVFWHFVADWLFQSHKEALAKASFPTVRAIHCIKYTLAFLPIFWLLRAENLTVVWSMLTLLLSHYVIDSYVPVMLWAKHLRKAPQFDQVKRYGRRTAGTYVLPTGQPITFTGPEHAGRGWVDNEVDELTYANDKEAFKAFAGTPLGLVLMITMDQLFHIAFLLPVAWFIVVW